MKPTMQTIENEKSEQMSDRRFPVIDFSYQSVALDGYGGSCAKVKGPSFHSISSDYFKDEACNYFLAEALVFGAILATAVLPLVNGACAVLHLAGMIGGV